MVGDARGTYLYIAVLQSSSSLLDCRFKASMEIQVVFVHSKCSYIHSATLNGVPLTNSWFRHSQIANGRALIFIMGSAPATWGTSTPPPSMSDPVSLLFQTAH